MSIVAPVLENMDGLPTVQFLTSSIALTHTKLP